jgi:hypothetical protein
LGASVNAAASASPKRRLSTAAAARPYASASSGVLGADAAAAAISDARRSLVFCHCIRRCCCDCPLLHDNMLVLLHPIDPAVVGAAIERIAFNASCWWVIVVFGCDKLRFNDLFERIFYTTQLSCH